MKIKAFLIIVPVFVVAALVQSYFWVPTYESQAAGNPLRNLKFIEASIGDAKILNPILSADSASSRITQLVFEGLLDLDEDLNLRGRLATDWTVTETAYLLVDEAAALPDGAAVTRETLLERLRAFLASPEAGDLGESVLEVDIAPAGSETLALPPSAPDQAAPPPLAVQVPVRLRLRLDRVDQDLLAKLRPLLGADYGAGIDRSRWLEPGTEPSAQALALLAARFPLLEHNPEITFSLRRGVTFHDGHGFDAGDVVFTYDSIMNPRNLSPRTSDYEPIKNIEVIDPHRVKIVYKRLFSPAVSAWTMGILPEHLLNDEALKREAEERGLSAAALENFGMRDSRFNRAPVGSGPFRFREWQSDEMIHLSRNEDYWEGPPEYRDYYYRIIPDALTQEVEFRTGAIDTYVPQPHQVARYKADDTYQTFSSLVFAYAYIGYNLRRAPFDDPAVRRALSMAIDIDAIIEHVLYDQGERTTGPYPKNTEWYDHEVAPIPYDPEGALRLLEENGWRRNAEGWLEKDGKLLEFTLITNHGNAVRKSIMTIAQNSWRQIGIKVRTELFEWAVFLQDFINPGQFDATVLGWSMGIDPDLYQIWHSSQAGPNQLNFVGYKSAEADRLIERIRREYDHDKQRALAHELHALIARDQPYTFIYAARAARALDRKIVMVEPDGSLTKVRPSRSGQIYFHLNRWRKLDAAPQF